MVRATLELLAERDPDQITVRDIAERLDFNRPTSEIPDPLVRRVVRLMNWLIANDPGSISRDRMRPVLSRLQHMYEDRFGIDPVTASLLAQRLMFLMSGLVLFKDVVAAGSDDIPRQVVLEFEVARLLGTRPG